MSTRSKQSYRDSHKRRHVSLCIQPVDDQHDSLADENLRLIKLRRRRHVREARSFYDNDECDENECVISKWTIVRQRLPDILALSETYKPTSVRAQLVLLVALMNRQIAGLVDQSNQLNKYEYNNAISHIVPNNVTLDISGRSRLICLKRIPAEQVIHVDVDGLSFTIPTRQFILSISRGNAQKTAAKYCPPAMSEMLTNISKSKIIDESRQYKRAQFKMRIGQTIFLSVFLLILTMVFTLVIGATKTLFQLDSFNQTFPYIPIRPVLLRNINATFPVRTEKEDSHLE